MTEKLKPAFTPFPGKSTEFIQSTCSRILYGGARGGGKSFSLAFKAAFQVRKWHYFLNGKPYENLKDIPKNMGELQIIIDKISIDYPDYVGLLLRRTYPDIVKNLKIECDKLYTLPKYQGEWKERDHCYIFPSGAKIFLNHCMDEKALRSFIGGNYTFIGIDEANQFYGDWIDKIDTSLRSTNPELKPMLCLTANPGDVGHHYLKTNFVDKCPPITKAASTYSEEFDVSYHKKLTGMPYTDDENIEYQFIPATVFDNPAILENDKIYVRKLKSLNPTLRAMWLNGDWDVVSGMFFDMWDINKHVISSEKFRYGKEITLEKYSLYRFYDYGTKNPFVCLFGALGENDKLIIFDEIVETGLSAKKQAEFVNHYTYDKYGLKPEHFTEEIADPAYQIKGSDGDDLVSPAESYADQGIYLIFGNNDRAAGAKVLYDALDIPTYNDIAKVRITDNCEYLIRTIPTIQSDRIDPEKYDTRGEDHGVDALRYGVTRVLESSLPKLPEREGWRKKLAIMASKYRNSSGKSAEGWRAA